MHNELLTAEEMAGRLRVRPGTVRAWARRGVIPSIKPTAKVVRFDPAAVIAAMQGRRRGTEGGRHGC